MHTLPSLRTLGTGFAKALLLLLTACPSPAGPVKSDDAPSPGRIQHAAIAGSGGGLEDQQIQGMQLAPLPPSGTFTPGQFDFYVLSLSWSPQHCYEKGSRLGPNDPQCGGSAAYGFIVHGLWPQFTHGYPESCAAAPELNAALVQRIMRIMPSEKLIHHEWEKHGTCSGLSAEDYFGHLEALRSGLQIPARYAGPKEALSTTPAALRQEFLAGNAAFPPDGSSLSLVCQDGYLQELRVCFSKDYKPQRCTDELRDSCPASINVRPLMSH